MTQKKPITVLEIIVALVILAVFGVYSVPVFFTPKAQKQQASVRANVAMAVSTATARFSLKNKKFTATEVASMTARTLNVHAKNPFNKKLAAYAADKSGFPSVGTVVLIPDNAKKQVEIKGYGNDLTKPLITRVVQGYEYTRTEEGKEIK